MLYLYALTDHPAVVPSARGLAETPLAVERVDGIEAVVGVVDRERIDASEDAVLTHARIVDELAAVNEAVLPARFGRGYPDAEALRNAVAEQADALRQALDRVRGCLELGLRVLSEPSDGDSPGSGRAYMLDRLERRRRAESLADEVHAPLAALARAETRTVGATPQLLLSAAYLVPREDLERFQSVLQELEGAHPELSMACTGPWPPYSFATAEIESR
jgi:Gas vesicle synthesis protein GvpL/GvpF